MCDEENTQVDMMEHPRALRRWQCVCIKEGLSDLRPREEKGSHHQKLGVGKPGAIFQTEGTARTVALRLVCGRVSEQGLWAVGTVRILSCESQETTGVFRGKGS